MRYGNETKAVTLVNSTLSSCTVRIASVRPCKNAFVIAGSYVHSVRPKGNQHHERYKQDKLTIQAKVRCLERHLNERVRAEPMAGNKILAISFKLQCLTVVLTDQVAQPRLCEPDSDTDLGCERPHEFGRAGIVSIEGGSAGSRAVARVSLGRLV